MKQNLTSEQSKALINYREFVYSQVLTHRRASQFELMDALLGMGAVSSYPELSESSAFRRKSYLPIAPKQRRTKGYASLHWMSVLGADSMLKRWKIDSMCTKAHKPSTAGM